MPTNVPNARKGFNFRIEINGLNQFEVQKITLPEIEIDKVEHGDTNRLIKTAGMIKLGDLKLEKLVRLPGSDLWAWQWLTSAQDMTFGTGNLANVYKRSIVIREMSPTGLGILNSWIIDGAWVSKISQSDFTRTESDNIIQTLEISCDGIIKI